jgi:arylsulfate sulfotransferase
VNKPRVLVCFLVGILINLGSVGCGSNLSTPGTSISATSNPLVAQYSVWASHQGLTAWVEFGTDTSYGRQTAVVQSALQGSPLQQLNILVAGMKQKTTYHMRVHASWPGGSWVDQDRTFTTGAVPSSLAPPQIKVSAPTASSAPAPGVELLSMVESPHASLVATLITDLQGNIIWYCPVDAIPFKPMPNGHFLFNMLTHLQEVDLACNTVRDVPVAPVNQSLQANGYDFQITPQELGPAESPFHHDMLVLPNGHWIALTQTTKSFTDLPGYPGTTVVIGDALVDIDLNGNVAWAWNSFDHLDVNRHPYFGLPDWTHSNALIYTPDGNLLLSMRAQSWVLKIDYANGSGSGNILWKLGPDGDFTLLGGNPTEWFYSQHYPNLLNTNGSQMTLGVMDNGDYRTDASGVQCETTPTSPPCYSRATIFQVDESTFLASLQWQDSPGLYSLWGGSVGTLSNGDFEFDMTTVNGAPASQITEVTQTDNPQTVWQMNVMGENAYRGYRIPSLYPGVTWKK